jgi:hypothetical protein
VAFLDARSVFRVVLLCISKDKLPCPQTVQIASLRAELFLGHEMRLLRKYREFCKAIFPSDWKILPVPF